MKLQKIVERLQKLHPKEIDLSLDRTINLCQKLGNPQDQINCVSIVGTNGKYSTIQALYAILKEANYKCNIYTSPHIKKINERFVYNNEELSDDDLTNLLTEIEEVNNNEPITFFEILTVAYFHHAKKYPKNINLIESGLFHRFDATNILKKNLASIITTIGLDHLDWLPKEEQTIEKIIFEKASSLLNSKIIVAKQSSNKISAHIENTIAKHPSVSLTAVVAKPDEKWGEIPCAFIELIDGKNATEKEIINFCRETLAGFKLPRKVVFSSLPKTSTGKIQKFELRKKAKELS